MTRAGLAMAALALQALIPFVIAAHVAAGADAFPICHSSTSDEHKSGQPNPVNSCPICIALAASVAVTLPAPPALPLPHFTVAVTPALAAHEAAEISLPTPYRSRAPPVLA
jgi:hypothetical protein